MVPVPSAVHGAWTDAVVVDLVVHNTSSTPVELSPGQFRVHVGGHGATVSLSSADGPGHRSRALLTDAIAFGSAERYDVLVHRAVGRNLRPEHAVHP